LPLSDAYVAQDALHSLLQADGSGEIAGWKVALTSETMQRITNCNQPVAGAVFANSVHSSPCVRSVKKHHHLTVECEVAVRLKDDMPRGRNQWTKETVLEHVEAMLPSFELVDDGHADYSKLDAWTLTAQNAWNGGAVLGAPVVDFRNMDLVSMKTTCWVDDQLSGEGKAGDCMGHPLEAVAWMANLLNSQGKMLKKGEIVLTGSTIKPIYPNAGQKVRFEVEGLGEVNLEVVE
jgi:2-keto-4-pentenoate hydratase